MRSKKSVKVIKNRPAINHSEKEIYLTVVYKHFKRNAREVIEPCGQLLVFVTMTAF